MPPHSAKGPKFVVQTRDGEEALAVASLPRQDQEILQSMSPDTLAELLSVRVADAEPDVPDVSGRVVLQESALYFAPRYPLRPGMRYRVVYRPSRLPGGDTAAEDVVDELTIFDPEPGPPTEVTRVYPTADRLPENQLKFYIHFSAPMSRGEAYQRVHLLDAQGNEVDAPFLELGQELWDPDMRRFTLLFDPGRIKRGLKPREEIGPVLEAGKRYTLVVDADWADAGGRSLAAEMRKTFDVLPPDDAPLDVEAWQIDPPASGTTDPLVVRFGEPLDHSLLGRMVQVIDPNGERISGAIEVTDHESCWRFKPRRPWTAGQYQLVADTRLEDLAGNSIGRAFDVDVFERVEQRITTENVSVSFSIAEE